MSLSAVITITHLNVYFYGGYPYMSHVSHLIKASDDLIQQSEAVHSFMFDLLLLEILVEPIDGSEHDTHFIIGLRVELLQCVGPRYLDRWVHRRVLMLKCLMVNRHAQVLAIPRHSCSGPGSVGQRAWARCCAANTRCAPATPSCLPLPVGPGDATGSPTWLWLPTGGQRTKNY